MFLRDLINTAHKESKRDSNTLWKDIEQLLNENDFYELRWKFGLLTINYSNLFIDYMFWIYNDLFPNFEKFKLDEVLLILKIILNDKLKEVLKMKKERWTRIELCISVMKYWVKLKEKKTLAIHYHLDSLLTKLEDLTKVNVKIYSNEIGFLANRLRRAIKIDNYETCNNMFKSIINLLLKGVDEN